MQMLSGTLIVAELIFSQNIVIGIQLCFPAERG